jgi:Mg2+/Co2+ transporter CorB
MNTTVVAFLIIPALFFGICVGVVISDRRRLRRYESKYPKAGKRKSKKLDKMLGRDWDITDKIYHN